MFLKLIIFFRRREREPEKRKEGKGREKGRGEGREEKRGGGLLKGRKGERGVKREVRKESSGGPVTEMT